MSDTFKESNVINPSNTSKKNIFTIFWTNVDWHRRNKGLNWKTLVGGNSHAAAQKNSNVTLKKIESIAEKLDIDDYAILFEE